MPTYLAEDVMKLLIPWFFQVQFKVNNVEQNYAMKLGEGGEAFFVFETSDNIPESMQTSPVLSPAASPYGLEQDVIPQQSLQEPEHLDLNTENVKAIKGTVPNYQRPADLSRAKSDFGALTPMSTSPGSDPGVPINADIMVTKAAPLQVKRSASEELLTMSAQPRNEIDIVPSHMPTIKGHNEPSGSLEIETPESRERSNSPPLLSANDAVNRAKSLSKKLSMSQIPSHVTDTGDLMLDMTGYKSSEDQAIRAEVIARKILSEELEGQYDIGALIGADEQGNLWIYSSEEAKETAGRKNRFSGLNADTVICDAASDPGYHSDEELTAANTQFSIKHQRTQSAANPSGLVTPPQTPPASEPTTSDPNRNFAKTLRLTSDQLKGLNLRSGENTMSFSVNRATCLASMYYWTHDVPIVISDIDGTITKSDALGHVLNMIGRDWTHTGVAKLYSDIVANGYNIFYLTSRSVGQADTTRTYLNGVSQEGFKLPKGPVIMSPDRTIAALRREIYLRQPEAFKMACLRDIMNLFGQKRSPFYAGFGNRLTDALSYRSVNIPSTRIFTINSNAEVSLDLLTLNKYKSSYVTMREVVDHFFPPVGLLITGGAEGFTDFNYWREAPLDIEDFSDGDDGAGTSTETDRHSLRSEDEGSDNLDDNQDDLVDSFMSRNSTDEGGDLVDSILGSIDNDDMVARRSTDDKGRNLSGNLAVEAGSRTRIDDNFQGDDSEEISKRHFDQVKAVKSVRSILP
ncbi:lipin Ned1 [Lecanora helva]